MKSVFDKIKQDTLNVFIRSRSDYSIERRKMVSGLLIGIFSYPFFWLLDLVYYPNHIGILLLLRLAFSFYLVCWLFIYLKAPEKRFKWFQYLLFIPGSLVISVMPIIGGDGFASQYFGGSLLLLLTMLILVTSTKHLVIMFSIMWSLHILVIAIGCPFDFKYFTHQAFILVSSSIIGIILNRIINNHARREKEATDQNKYFLQVFSHDIKNRITIGEYMMDKLKKRYTADKTLILLSNEHGLMNIMLANLLNVFSLKPLELNPQPACLHSLISNITSTWTEKFKAADITFQTQLESETRVLAFDENYMQLVWDNLLSNILQNTPKGGVAALIVRDSDAAIIFEFSNNGTTVPKSSRSQLFRKYASPKLHSPYNKGLGLNYAKMMIERHNGEIYYRVREDGQNCFTVKLPIG